LRGFNLESSLQADDILAMTDRFRERLLAEFQPKSALVEVPFKYTNASGQRLAGFIDLLLETDRGWVIIDHKSFPGPREAWPAKTLSFSGQIASYQSALAATGYQLASAWVHFAVGGGLVEIGRTA
jgi:ATP-dependent helicase/nuclease subunit A